MAAPSADGPKGSHTARLTRSLKSGSRESTKSARSSSHVQVGSLRTVDAQTAEEERVKHPKVSWLQAALVMIAETISLGILSLPKAISKMGFIPGGFVILSDGLITWYTGYPLQELVRRNPEVHSYADALRLVFGRYGGWLGWVMQTLVLVFLMGGHVMVFSQMMNTTTDHATCTIWFKLLGAFVSFLFTLPRTLKANSHFSLMSCVSICAATVIAMVGVSYSRPGIGNTYLIVPAHLTSFHDVASSMSSIIIAYMGHIAYPSIICEMEEPKDFPKALALSYSITTSLYVTVAIVVYYYAGQGVLSPALGSASPLIRKVAFGVAIPTIIIAGVIAAVVARKNIEEQFWQWKGTPQVLYEKTLRSRISIVTVDGLLWMVAYIISEVIPALNLLLGVIGAAFGSWFCLGFPAIFWFWLDWRHPSTSDQEKTDEESGNSRSGSQSPATGKPDAALTFKQQVRANIQHHPYLAMLNLLILVMCVVICVIGMYGSVASIAVELHNVKLFSCANNV